MKNKNFVFTILLCCVVALTLVAFTGCHKHEYTSQTTDATCTRRGIIRYTCECGDKYSEMIPVKGHSGGTATCLQLAVCVDCGETYGELATHTYATEFSFDDTHCWYDSTCGCDIKKDHDPHIVDISGECQRCHKTILVTEGVQYAVSSDNTYAEVTGYTGASTSINILSVYNGLPVKKIADQAFRKSNIEMVVIPSSITHIGEYAFFSCSNLTILTMGNNVKYIGEGAFYYCSSLVDIVIPESIDFIGDAFYGCSSLNYNVKEGLNYLGNMTNPYLVLMSPTDVNLTTCTINDATKIVSDKTFSNCNKLTSVVIPQNVTSIGNSAFSGCTALETVTMGDGVRRIGSGAFAGCNALKYNVKDNLKYLGNQANPYMVLVGVADANLESYTIDQNTKIICDKAFNNCKVMTSIVISDAVIFMGEFVFANCELLETINCKATEQPSDWNSEWNVGTTAEVVWNYKG